MRTAGQLKRCTTFTTGSSSFCFSLTPENTNLLLPLSLKSAIKKSNGGTLSSHSPPIASTLSCPLPSPVNTTYLRRRQATPRHSGLVSRRVGTASACSSRLRSPSRTSPQSTLQAPRRCRRLHDSIRRLRQQTNPPLHRNQIPLTSSSHSQSSAPALRRSSLLTLRLLSLSQVGRRITYTKPRRKKIKILDMLYVKI